MCYRRSCVLEKAKYKVKLRRSSCFYKKVALGEFYVHLRKRLSESWCLLAFQSKNGSLVAHFASEAGSAQATLILCLQTQKISDLTLFKIKRNKAFMVSDEGQNDTH